MATSSKFVVDYVFQKEWGTHGRSLLIMLAIYFGGIGGGLYLVSLLAGYPEGALLGILIGGVGKGLSHIFFLGRPERFWRAIRRPHSSWISRGFIFFGVFLLSGLGYVLPSFGWLPWATNSGFGVFLYWVSIITALLTVTYTGLLLNRSAIPFWNHSLLPILFLSVSILSGASLAGFALPIIPRASAQTALIHQVAVWGGIASLVLLGFYFWSAYTVNTASQRSVRFLAFERQTAWYFYGAFLIVGLAFPLAVNIANAMAGVPLGLLMTAELLEVVVGAVLFRYVFLRGGVFLPVI